MNRKILLLFPCVVLTLLAFSACTFFSPVPLPTAGPDALHTQAAQTVSVRLTQIAVFSPTPLSENPTATDQVQSMTATSGGADAATATPLPIEPTPTSAPTSTPVPATPTQIPPTLTAIPIPCDWVQYLTDVRIKDGSNFTAGSLITKTWRLKNIGTCTWTTDYDLVFASGDQMNGPKAVALPGQVKPGQTIDLSVDLTAPDKKGNYRGYWQLRNTSNKVFGVGSSADKTFWVDINVIKPNADYVYDFSARYCSAIWKSQAGKLACPGVQDDPNGFVLYLDAPKIEKNRQENEPALWTQPQEKKDGWIRGEFPVLKVETGYHFKAVVGCLAAATKCDVKFQLQYSVDGGDLTTLWDVHQVYDGSFTTVDVDLSSLVGKNVEFNLTVLANGSADGDQAFWLSPRIVFIP